MIVVIWLMILLIPGLIGAFAYEFACCKQIKYGYRFISAALIFDLLALVINLLWLRFLKLIFKFANLDAYFNCLSFTSKYAILNMILCCIIGLTLGLICKCMCKKHRLIREDDKQ